MRISERKFCSYVDVQASGIVDMRNIDEVVEKAIEMNEISLTKNEVKYIQRHYLELVKLFGIGGWNSEVISLI